MNGEDFKRLEQLFLQFNREIRDDSQRFKDDIKQDLLVFKDDSQRFKDDIKQDLLVFKDDSQRFKADIKQDLLVFRDDSQRFRDDIKQDLLTFKEEVKAEFRHQIGIQSEHFQHKLDIVVEGHEVLRKEIRDTREELCEKIKFVDFKVGVINQKLDAVAVDLSAHRADTEVHKKVYKVKED